jgi:hypothetical protein
VYHSEGSTERSNSITRPLFQPFLELLTWHLRAVTTITTPPCPWHASPFVQDIHHTPYRASYLYIARIPYSLTRQPRAKCTCGPSSYLSGSRQLVTQHLSSNRLHREYLTDRQLLAQLIKLITFLTSQSRSSLNRKAQLLFPNV